MNSHSEKEKRLRKERLEAKFDIEFINAKIDRAIIRYSMGVSRFNNGKAESQGKI